MSTTFLKYLDDLEHERALQAELHGKAYSFIIDPPHRWSKWAAPKTKDGAFDHAKALTGPDLVAYVDGELFPYLRGFKSRAERPTRSNTRSSSPTVRSAPFNI